MATCLNVKGFQQDGTLLLYNFSGQRDRSSIIVPGQTVKVWDGAWDGTWDGTSWILTACPNLGQNAGQKKEIA